MSSFVEEDLFSPSLSPLDDRPGTTPLPWHRRPLHPWSLMAVTVGFGFWVGGLAAARNWALLGEPRRMRRALLAVAGVTIATSLLCWTTWRLGLFLMLMPLNPLSMGLVWLIASRQPLRPGTLELPTLVAIALVAAGFGWFMAMGQVVLGPGRT